MPFGQGAQLIELIDERGRLEREAGAVKGRLTQINERINEIVKPALDAVYLREGKSSGTVKFVFDNHMMKVSVTKRIDWDSDILKEIETEISEALARNLFKKIYSVPDANFRAVLDPTLKARLTLARTVRYDTPKVTLAEDEDA